MNAKRTRAEAATVGIWTEADLMDRCHVDENDCWHWRGACCKGRPRLWFGPFASVTSMGAVIAFLRTGKRPRSNAAWRPTCQTQCCANPAHNVLVKRSTYQKGRKFSPAVLLRMAIGNASRAKLPQQSVEVIRGSDKSGRELAKEHGICKDYANLIKAGKARVRTPQPGFSVFSWSGVNP